MNLLHNIYYISSICMTFLQYGSSYFLEDTTRYSACKLVFTMYLILLWGFSPVWAQISILILFKIISTSWVYRASKHSWMLTEAATSLRFTCLTPCPSSQDEVDSSAAMDGATLCMSPMEHGSSPASESWGAVHMKTTPSLRWPWISTQSSGVTAYEWPCCMLSRMLRCVHTRNPGGQRSKGPSFYAGDSLTDLKSGRSRLTHIRTHPDQIWIKFIICYFWSWEFILAGAFSW